MSEPRRAARAIVEGHRVPSAEPLRGFAQGSLRRVLLIDPHEPDRRSSQLMLQTAGFEVTAAASRDDVLAGGLARGFDLVVVEPAGEGLETIVFELAEAGDAPVLVLSRQAETLDRVHAIEQGADDVLPKDAHPLEVIARIRGLIRRGERGLVARQLQGGGCYFHPHRQCVIGPRGTAAMPPSLVALLLALVREPNTLLSRQMLAQVDPGPRHEIQGRTIDVRIRRLRERLEECGGSPELVRSVRPKGYLLAGHARSTRDGGYFITPS